MKAYLESQEVQRLEDVATNLRDRLLVRLLFHLGCRVSEALAITVGDIDFAHGTVTIQHLKMRINLTCPRCTARLGKSHSFCPKCGLQVEDAIAKEQEHRRMRTLPLDSNTLATLRAFVDRGGPVVRGGKTVIFSINRHRAWQIIRDCGDRADVPGLVNPDTGKARGVSPHRLRDAFAVHAVKTNDSGDGLRMLQEHLGHTSFNTTARYRKVSGDEHRGWYDKLWDGQA